MDPDGNQRDTRNYKGSASGTSGGYQTSREPGGNAADGENSQATSGQPQYLGAFTMIPPKEARHNKLKMMAQEEEEGLQRWKEANRAQTVQLNPEKLGGNATLAGAREKQFRDLRSSKLQKKLRQDELDKRRRQEEEEENQKKKDQQREKAERLEEKKRQEERRRREQFGQDHVRKTDAFLQKFEWTTPGPLASSRVTHARLEPGESKHGEEWKSSRELEHRRVNSTFLDNLEARVRGSEKETNEQGIQERPPMAPEDFRHRMSNPSGQQPPLPHLETDPEQSYYREEAEPDDDWALMKLMNSFPEYNRAFLEDILEQCNSDYQQAYTLLTCNE